jgi:hypothetical protein
MLSFRSSARIDRPGYAWIAVALQLITAVGAIPVGISLIQYPDGSGMQMPADWIRRTPFGTYLLPGIVLLAMNGFGQGAAALLIALRQPLAPWLTGFFGVGLIIWIAIQMLLMPFSVLQPILLAAGTVQGFVALFWLRRLGFVHGRRPWHVHQGI